VRDGVISEPLRIFAPGFGAGAVAGYAVLRVDPAVVAISPPPAPRPPADTSAPEAVEDAPASEGVRDAFA
jgi:hypothetical protein